MAIKKQFADWFAMPVPGWYKLSERGKCHVSYDCGYVRGQEEMRERAAVSCETEHQSCKVKRTCHEADAIHIRNLSVNQETK